jgi:Tfp pilus assembly protein PilV
MVTLGFVAGALIAVLDKDTVRWDRFALAAGLGVLGVILMRATDLRSQRDSAQQTANLDTLQASLDRIVTNITALNADKQDMSPYDVHGRIDQLFQDDRIAFVEARESISHRYGLQAYADVMSAFAAAERYLNRVWSASADGYVDEVHLYLERACEQFKLSLNKIKDLEDRRIVGNSL